MKKFLLFLAMMTAMAGVRADYSARQALADMPVEKIGMIDRTERLDMIDFYEANLLDRTVNNRRGGKARLTHLTDSTFTIVNGEVETISGYLLAGKSDTLVAIIRTLATPALDSKLTVYDRQWQPRTKSWTEPAMKQWGKSSAKFLLTEYQLRGDTLTLRDQTSEWNPEWAPKVKELKYLWNRKSEKFVPLK